MAYLLTDAGEYRPLPCPATFSIGRANDNSFRPESQSVSKRHAILETSFLYGTEKIEVSIEDLKSTNGTFVGDSPLDFEPVVGKRKISFGTYIRFGFSQKYFRLVDRITEINPVQDEIEVVAPSFPATRKSNGNFQSAEIIDESVAHGRINDGFLQLTKAKWAGGEGREFLTSSVFGPCKELINKSLLSEKITSKMQASINNFTPFIPYGVENCSLQDYINSTEIIRGIWFELFDFNTSIIPNSLHGNQLLCYFLNLKSLPELLEVTTKEIEGDDTLLIDLMLASQRCDLQSFIRDIGGAIHLFQKILIVSIRSEITSSTGEGPSNEISSALLTEIASTLISCCKKIQHHETISISKMVESCYKLGPTATSELESLLSFLQDVGGSLNQNGLSILHRDEINSIVRNCTRLFVEANLILTCYYIVFLSVALCLQEKLEIYMKSKNGKEAHTLLDNFRQAVLQGDDDTLNKLIENIRAKDQQVIGRRNLK